MSKGAPNALRFMCATTLAGNRTLHNLRPEVVLHQPQGEGAVQAKATREAGAVGWSLDLSASFMCGRDIFGTDGTQALQLLCLRCPPS